MKVLISSLMIATAIATLIRAQEESASPSEEAKTYPEVPKQYEVGEDTISPDGRFAILYPVRDEDSNKGPSFPNVLVRLKPYKVIKELDVDPAWKEMRGAPAAKWGGNQFVAIWRQMKWGNEDLAVYELVNDKLKREERIWPEVVKYFDRDFHQRFLKKYPKEYDSFVIVSEHGEQRGRGDFQFEGRQLILDLSADNKPNLAAGPHWTAELHASWNLDTGKFDKVSFQPGKIDINGQL